ncbi:MAG: DNA polymerase III subunit gamma/tau [Bacteroidetes bacterium]|nr:DNA polymerase III subunit gamma/tau [Bacteroidota bacterium]
MNAFVVSARKYRPATFDTVVGQAHITDTLKNAIRTQHLAQAFLFCGPRGVGKTTCARILAKTLNCKTLTADMEACNACESCKSFNAGQSLNIYELDAASNNSVDDIRNLVEQVRYAPHSGEYKIYIIDEVHMLSSSAFNAFLKTLEEPPSYAVFILATTEKHKIIPTILSRCQIFDFNRIQVDDITKHLEYVAKQEEVVAEEEALHIIAQKADGALRDALSIFDQIVSFAGTNITYKDVINNLSILDYDYYFKITDEIREGNIPGVLLTYNELISDGFDGHHFITGLASHFRDLLVSKTESTISLLEVSRSARERYKLQASEIVQANLLKYLSICSKCDIEYRTARNQRLHVELALIRLCSISGMLEEGPAPAIQKKSEVKTEVKKEVAKKSEVAEPSSPPLSKVDAETPVAIAAEKISIEPTLSPSPSRTPPPSPSPTPSRTPTPPSQTGSSIFKGASLSSFKKSVDTIAEESVKDELPDLKDSFDHETLLKFWKMYSDQALADGKIQLSTTMNINTPVIHENYQIELLIDNPAQQELFQEERTELVNFLRKRLNNYTLNVYVKLDDSAKSGEVAYTNKEKYQKMVEKNPGLDDFRKQLGLELEL